MVCVEVEEGDELDYECEEIGDCDSEGWDDVGEIDFGEEVGVVGE